MSVYAIENGRFQWVGRTGPARVLLLLLLAGCAPTPRPVQPSAFAPVRILSAPIELMEYPRDIKAEYKVPVEMVQQIFSWDQYGGQWKVNVLRPTKLTAGYFFNHPIQLSEKVSQKALTFRFIPVEAETEARITLLDANGQPLREVTLAGHRLSMWRDWGRYAISIPLFLHQDNEKAPREAVFSGVQITIRKRASQADPVAVRDLRIGPSLWGMPEKAR
ncbi:MAG: hypothetical protein EOM20_02395 [Spartobacteria bacterium]|nr:hypothetical protein [Spartobacteria bacterium]